MDKPAWPDALQPANPNRVRALLTEFWPELSRLADLIPQGQLLLAAEQLHFLRGLVLEMMLALNGIARPAGTVHLNAYLGASQRVALEKTLHLPKVTPAAFMAQAVALVTIYRWYAPQLLAVHGGDYPQSAEDAAWNTLTRHIPDWPLQVTTDA